MNPFREQYIELLIRLANDNPKPLIIGNRARQIISFFAVDKRRKDERKELVIPYWLRQFRP